MRVFPLYVHCGISGFESPAHEYREIGLSLDQLLIRNPNATFIGVASGNSMEKVGIFNKDILIVDRARKARHGSIIVANYNGEFICKIWDEENNCLLSASDNQSPIRLSEGDVFQLEGSVPISVRQHDEHLNLAALINGNV
ncbi:LexA family protein [Thalassotalea marina]|uniref:DNA polymerase V n=1 Tax=Thalassotalea marina TaxID=1673741 RepID=A0A919EQE5_9GAMM|nr:S24 family peptidase [Thalassotalea marina]GHG07759.1 DNA polymerase V [Thalassotalea marina]